MDMAEADALPARAAAPSPQRAAPAPAPIAAPAPPMAVAQAPQRISPSLPESPPAPPPAPRPAAASPASNVPASAGGLAVAQAPLPPAPRPEPSGPTMVWQQGPSAIVSADAAEGRFIDSDNRTAGATSGLPASIASLDMPPIPPRRPASFESIGTLVTAFADSATAATASADPLAQLGLRGEISSRDEAPQAENGEPAATVVAIAIEAPIPVPRRAVTETASTNRRSPPSRDLVATARDPRASWRALFAEEPHVDDSVRHAAASNGNVRYAQARPQGREAPAGFVGVRDSGLALGFAREPVPGPGVGTFSGPAVAPLPVRQ